MNVSTEELVHRIADELLATAIVAGGRATWLTPWPSPDDEARTVLLTGEPTLYGGSAGIALACAEVGRRLDRPDLVELGRAAARHAVSRLAAVDGGGLYDGRSGIGLAALAVGTVTEDDALRDAGAAVLDALVGHDPDVDDVISGAAGVAVAFVRAAAIDGRSAWLEHAATMGRLLVARAQRNAWGWSWRSGGDDPTALCGLAHGSAGVAWALGELDRAGLADADGREASARACQFERSWFDPRTSTWPDLRTTTAATTDAVSSSPTFWCHGSAGIGVSRLVVDSCADRDDLSARGELAAALQSSCSRAAVELDRGEISGGLTVCHGLGGTVDLLLDAHVAQHEPQHRAAATWIVERAVELLGNDVDRWPGGVRDVPAAGLMTGLAGTLVTLARLAGEPSGGSVGQLRLCADLAETPYQAASVAVAPIAVR